MPSEDDMMDTRDPLKVLQEAAELTQQGKYEQALENHLWFHEHALACNPALVGVRLSFALASWLALGEKYPKARQALVAVRDANAQAITDGNGSFAMFHDMAAINEILKESPRTAALFKVVHQAYPDLAKQCYRVAEPHLTAQKDYELCAAYIPDGMVRFEVSRSQFQIKKSLADENPALADGGVREFAEVSFVVEVCQLIEILINVGRRAEAERIATCTRESFPSAPARELVDQALRGSFTESPALLASLQRIVDDVADG
jgi:hypothetical protein